MTIYVVQWYGGREYFLCKKDADKFKDKQDRIIIGVGEQCRLYSVEAKECSHDCDVG